MIFVLEGPDLAGKSTAARQLMADAPNRELLKKGPPNKYETIMYEYLRPISDRHHELAMETISLVLDRWHVGELVYGPLLRGKSLLTRQQADYIDMVLQSFGCRFLHVSAPLDVLQSRYDMRGDGLIKREQLKEIIFQYDLQLSRRHHWAITNAEHSSQGFTSPSPAPRAGRYIGPKTPKVLLLGDQRNDQRFIFPFVPERASSGHWLMGAMHAAEVNHMDVGIMNACEVDPGILFAQWQDLGMPPVICLGHNAARQWNIAHQGDWDDVGIMANHPQWMRRFAYTAMESYGRTIKDAMDG